MADKAAHLVPDETRRYVKVPALLSSTREIAERQL